MAEPSFAQRSQTQPTHGVSLGQAFRTWMRVAMLSFGGPAGQIAVMHRILVEEKRWISENRFLHALNYCMLLPGPEAQQLATYIGWLMHRTLGGIMAGALFVIPGIIAIMALSYIYAAYGNVPLVAALFFGLKAAVLAIVLEAVFRIGKRSLKNNAMRVLAAAAFIGIFFFAVPFPIIIFGAALIGFVGASMSVPAFQLASGHGPQRGAFGDQAAVVGVVLNLAIWFALHTIFRDATPVHGYGVVFDAPVVASVDPWALALSAGAMTAIFRFEVGMIPTLAACCVAGIVLHLTGAIE